VVASDGRGRARVARGLARRRARVGSVLRRRPRADRARAARRVHADRRRRRSRGARRCTAQLRRGEARRGARDRRRARRRSRLDRAVGARVIPSRVVVKTYARFAGPIVVAAIVALAPVWLLALRAQPPEDLAQVGSSDRLAWLMVGLAVVGQLVLVGGVAATAT